MNCVPLKNAINCLDHYTTVVILMKLTITLSETNYPKFVHKKQWSRYKYEKENNEDTAQTALSFYFGSLVFCNLGNFQLYEYDSSVT